MPYLLLRVCKNIQQTTFSDAGFLGILRVNFVISRQWKGDNEAPYSHELNFASRAELWKYHADLSNLSHFHEDK